VVLLKCPCVLEIIHGRAAEVFLQQLSWGKTRMKINKAKVRYGKSPYDLN
jgi:hypothetical protein